MLKTLSSLLKVSLIALCACLGKINGAAAQSVKLTALSPAFYTQSGRPLTQSGDKDGWEPQIGKQQFGFGINAYVNSEIVYILNGKYKKFTAWVGVESGDTGKTTAVFQVFGDGNKIFDSDTLSTTSPARKVELDVTNINELELVVHGTAASDPNHANNTGKINWAEPTLLINDRANLGVKSKTLYQVKGGNSTLSLDGQGKITGFLMAGIPSLYKG